MLTSNDQNQRFIFYYFCGFFDCENLYFIPSDCVDQSFLFKKLFFVFYFEETISVPIEIG